MKTIVSIPMAHAAHGLLHDVRDPATFGLAFSPLCLYRLKGQKRAEYGTELLKTLAERLTEEFGKGFSEDNLALMRKFYLTFEGRLQISETPSRKLRKLEKSHTSAVNVLPALISQNPTVKSSNPFTLSWSHYVLLLTIKDPNERSFYEIEATQQGWSLSELKRQKASSIYERLALSRDKDGIRLLAAKGQVIAKPEDALREPYVLEFLGLDEKAAYSETDLETAIIVELTLPEDANIHAREYQLYLPSKALLKQKLIEWAGAEAGK